MNKELLSNTKGTSIKNLITSDKFENKFVEERLTEQQQKYLAKFTKDGMCRKIKCVEDIFFTIFMSVTIDNKQTWILKPISFLYIKQLELISNNSRDPVQNSVKKLIELLKPHLINLENSETSQENIIKKSNIAEIITAINSMIEVLFMRTKPELKFDLECISILLLFGLKLEDYFFSEFLIQ